VAVSPSAIPVGADVGARIVSGSEAPRVLKLLTETIERNPGCFEGEDLSVAYGLQSLLQKYGQATLNEDGARVVAAAEKCAAVAKPSSGQRTPQKTSAAPAPWKIPIVPIVVGVGALGLFAIVATLAKRG